MDAIFQKLRTEQNIFMTPNVGRKQVRSSFRSPSLSPFVFLPSHRSLSLPPYFFLLAVALTPKKPAKTGKSLTYPLRGETSLFVCRSLSHLFFFSLYVYLFWSLSFSLSGHLVLPWQISLHRETLMTAPACSGTEPAHWWDDGRKLEVEHVLESHRASRKLSIPEKAEGKNTSPGA